jgi:hypothetical protein
MNPEMRPELSLVATLLGREFVPSKGKGTIRQGQQTLNRARTANIPQVIEQDRFEFGGMPVGVDNRMVQLLPDQRRP